jgi:2-polyprenyl-3-methyl-5-hydroxy-6-metoxy-1,4-benzoquinol methylase
MGSFRITVGKFLIRLGRFVQSLAVVMMRPGDLVEFSRRSYASPGSLSFWTNDEWLNKNLTPEEKNLLAQVPDAKGRLLLLGVGGGREAISLAKMGFEVVGVDYVPELVKSAQANALQRGVTLDGLVQEISRLEVAPGSFDLVWLTGQGMYSTVPTKNNRVQMLHRIKQALKPGGYFICQFVSSNGTKPRPLVELARKACALFTLGNLWYETGDTIWAEAEFVHVFYSRDELEAEFSQAGFEILYLNIPDGLSNSTGAVLRRQLK